MYNRMKQARKARNLTLHEVADLVHVTESAVSRYERGLISPSDAVVQLFCGALSISESWLRTGEGEMEVRPPEDIVDRLAREYHLGVPHVALLRAAARVIQEFPEDVALQLIDQIVADLQAARPDPQAAADAALNQRMQSHMPDRLQDDPSSSKCAQT